MDRIAARKTLAGRRIRPLLAVVAAAYLLVVCGLTLWPTHTERPVSVPVYNTTISAGGSPAQGRDALSLLDLVGNVALYLPLGVLLAVRLGPRRAIGFAAALSTAIELAQHFWLPGRDGTVRDVLCNVAGAALGAGLVVLLPRRGRH